MKRGTQIGGDNEKYKGHAFVIKIMGHHHIGMLEVLDMLHASGVDILEAKAESDGEFDVDVFVVQSAATRRTLTTTSSRRDAARAAGAPERCGVSDHLRAVG